jgi:hypothetical protein
MAVPLPVSPSHRGGSPPPIPGSNIRVNYFQKKILGLVFLEKSTFVLYGFSFSKKFFGNFFYI